MLFMSKIQRDVAAHDCGASSIQEDTQTRRDSSDYSSESNDGACRGDSPQNKSSKYQSKILDSSVIEVETQSAYLDESHIAEKESC
mmetsp:Transcript_14592/g.24893  ORF Transcript_14592/g.24893 Transcript_14592/m.24893 type:complete len:86 (+) Transcript_14592:835-1092(+)